VICLLITDFSAIQFLNFSGRKSEWPSWSVKFLAKAKRSGIKDVLLGKVEIPTSLDMIDTLQDMKFVPDLWINMLCNEKLKRTVST
jgi:hypothetical protein